ncbi:hypothetical protein [Enterobacter hormaechei]
MSTLTKEWLLKTIAELEEERDATPGAVNEDAAMALAAMKLALASLEAGGEACEACGGNGSVDIDHGEMGIEHIECPKCYTSQPAPVSVPDEVNVLLNHLEDVLPDDAFNLIDVKTWNNVSMLSRPDVYRAAMLQGAELQNRQQNIPEIIPGGLVEAVNNLLNNDGSRGCYSAIGCGEAREKIELWLAQRQKWESQRSENLCAGNSSVIPDGWVLVPVEPTMSQEFAGYRTLTDTGKMSRLMKTRLSNIYRAMIATAPQQEVK